MGMFWGYCTFSGKRWNDVFGGGFPDAERRVIASYMTWLSDGTEPDPEEDQEGWLCALVKQAPDNVASLAKIMCKEGVRYDGASDETAKLLDAIIVSLFVPEGIAGILEVKGCGGEGIKHFILEELLRRGRARRSGGFLGIGGTRIAAIPTEHTNFIVYGRRLGVPSAPSRDYQYLMYWPDEVRQARLEIELLLKSEVPWDSPEFEGEVRTNLLAVLLQAERDGSCVFGHYG